MGRQPEGARGALPAVLRSLCNVRPGEAILDVGAGDGDALERFNGANPIVAIDLRLRPSEWLARPNVTTEVGDGTALRFSDGQFPVVFSNSVIEHVPRQQQQAFADSIRRVGQRYYVQTPNRWFFIEPHYQMPFIHFLPQRVRRWLNARFAMGWRGKGASEEINLLSARDLRRSFPDGEIHKERLLGLTKSLMVVRRDRAS